MQHGEQHGSELLLIQKAIAGDKHAFGRLYEIYADQIFNYLFYRTEGYTGTADMTETVFLNAWENLPQFGRNGQGMNFRAWLYRIAHNIMVDHHRTKKMEISLDAIADQSAAIPDLLERSVNNEKSNQIKDALNHLDDISRQVVMLRFFAEMDHKETAKVLEMSESNVRVIQFRALKKMKGFLGTENE